MSLTPGQIDYRRTRLGGSDIAAAVGLHPWVSAVQCYLSKTDPDYTVPETETMWLGNALEPVLQTWHCGQHAREHIYRNCDTYTHGDWDWAIATPDAFVTHMLAPDKNHPMSYGAVFERQGGVEYKTVWSWDEAKLWGAAGDLVPPVYICQCQWYMEVCDLPWWRVVALIAPARKDKLREYTLQRDREFAAYLLEQGAEFMQRVRDRRPPHPDGSAGAGAALKRIYPESDERVVVADDDARSLATEYGVAVKAYKEAERERNRLQQEFKLLIGDASGIEDQHWHVTWRPDKKGTRRFHTTIGR